MTKVKYFHNENLENQITISFASDNRPYYRFNDDQWEQIGLLNFRNDQIELTGFRANVYAQSDNVDQIFIAFQSADTGTSHAVLTVSSPSENTDTLTPLTAFTSIPDGNTTDLNLRILVARTESGGMNEGRLSSITFYYNQR